MAGIQSRFTRDEVRIGGIFSLTGYLSWSGRYKKKAAELKIDMINDSGGIDGRRVRLIPYDDQSSEEQATKIAECLVFKHRVAAMVGTGSLHISRAVGRVANRYRTPAFVNSGYAIDPGRDLFVFNTAHRTEFAIACSFQYFSEKGLKRLALLMPNGPLGELGSRLARRLGESMSITIVDEERFDLAMPDVSGQLARLKRTRPDALFSFTTGQPAASIAQSMAAAGMQVPLLVSHGNANPRFLKMTSHAPVDIIVPSGKTMVANDLQKNDPCREVVMDFNAHHLARYGEPANYYSAELADALGLVAEGLRQAGNADSEGLREAVENIRGFEGMQGIYDLSPIDHYGTRIEQMVLLTVRNGAWSVEKTFSTISLFQDFHGDRKGSLIRKLTGLLPGVGTKEPIVSDEVPEFRDFLAARTGLNCTNLGPHLYYAAKLFYQQKLELTKSIRERDAEKAGKALFRLLTIVLLQHFDRIDALRLAVLELALALFDSAVDEGADIEDLIRLRHRFSTEWEELKEPEVLCLWITRALNGIIECLSASSQRKGADVRERVTRFIEAHLLEDLSVNRVARELGLGRSTLMHKLRNEYNLSLGECVEKARMDAAKHLLRNSPIPVSTVAQEVGYRDQSHFSRVFKKCVGQTPKDYRKRTSKPGTVRIASQEP
jgi:branched-chain amino acid transport system substrate-binding protein